MSKNNLYTSTKNICAKVCTEKVCRNVRAEFVPKLCTQKCAENAHTQNVQNCAHADLCRNVHTEFCAEVVRRVCVRVVRRVVSKNCVDEKFPVMHIRKFYAREHCPTCVQKVFAMCARRFAQIVHVRNCAQTVTCAKCQKWPKNDQK